MQEGKTTIVHEALISLASIDYTDETGFFFHTVDGGVIKYCPLNCANANYVTKTFAASETFNNPVLARKIFKTGTNATNIYIGKGTK